jgi:hypothetical protein
MREADLRITLQKLQRLKSGLRVASHHGVVVRAAACNLRLDAFEQKNCTVDQVRRARRRGVPERP